MIYYKMRNIFTDHLKSVGENYFEHFLKSFSFGMKLLYIALGAFIHAIFPWFFENSTSDRISELHELLQKRKSSSNSDKN